MLTDESLGAGEFLGLRALRKIKYERLKPELREPPGSANMNVHRFLPFVGIEKEDVAFLAKDFRHECVAKML